MRSSVKRLSENWRGPCDEEFWPDPSRRDWRIPAVGCNGRANAGSGRKDRRLIEFGCLVAVVAWLFVPPAQAALAPASLLVDIKTVSTIGTGINDSPALERVFLANGNPVPLGTPVWFVADFGNNGLRVESLGRSEVLPGEIFGADDLVVLRDTVDGDQPGSRAGVFRRVGVSLDVPVGQTAENLLRANIYAVAWNSAAVTDTPLVGSRFGILDLGVIPKPDFGNPFWAIYESFSAEQFAVVPEPAVTFAGGGALVAWAGWRLSKRALRRHAHLNSRSHRGVR